MIPARVAVLLPLRGGYAQVHRIERHEVALVFGAQARGGVRCDWIGRVEADICAVQAVEEFEIANQWRFGENIFEIPDLTPAVVPEHDVRNKPGIAQGHGDACDLLGIENRCLRLSQIVMNLWCDGTMGFVNDFTYPWQFIQLFLSDELYLVVRLSA